MEKLKKKKMLAFFCDLFRYGFDSQLLYTKGGTLVRVVYKYLHSLITVILCSTLPATLLATHLYRP